VERAIAPGLESAARSEGFADIATIAMRMQAEAARRTERAMRRALHLWNLPAGSDVKRVSEQIASLERRVRDLAKRVEELAEELHGQRTQSQRPRRPHSA
jgi:flagellar motility protein MotE (MotC chaperone)